MAAPANPTADSRITLRGALIWLGVLLVIVDVASAVWGAHADRERTEVPAQQSREIAEALAHVLHSRAAPSLPSGETVA